MKEMPKSSHILLSLVEASHELQLEKEIWPSIAVLPV